MILSIPYNRFEINNVQLQQFMNDKFNRSIALLTYNDSIEFKDITILSPPMKVIQYNVKSSTLRLDVSEHIVFQLKLYTFYEYLTNLLFMHQYDFFGEKNKTYDAIRQCFYTILNKSLLSLYIHPNTVLKYSEKDSQGMPISEVKSGDMVRCIIRIQGISQLMGKDGMRLRLHHYVPYIWKSDKR